VVKVRKPSQMETATQDSLKTISIMEKVSYSSTMGICMKVNSKMECKVELEFTLGKMVSLIQENTRTIKSTGKEFTDLKMVANGMEDSKKERNMAL
jgi:hypothetical protein